MEATSISCPLCGGHKKIFQQTLFQRALHAQESQRRPRHPVAADFVRDCSVCSGNGEIAAETLEAARQEARAWRAQGICRY